MNKTEKKYQAWVNDRNNVLEIIFNYYRKAISDRFRLAFSDLTKEFLISPQQPNIEGPIADAAIDISKLINEMRDSSHALTYAASLEVISGILGSSIKTNKPDVNLDADMLSGGKPWMRVVMYLNKVVRSMHNVADRAALAKEPLSPESFAKCFPRTRSIDNSRRPIKKLDLKGKEPKLKEAKKVDPDVSVTFMTDEQWDKILDKYKKDYVSPYRSGEFVVGKDLDDNDIYAWEFERDLQDELVKQVQSGQHEAYTKAGVKKFVWVAVLDNVTCEECCVWRDGLTTDEISRQLKRKRSKDICQAVVPPAHFNCRCTLVPAFDSLPDKPEVDFKSFDEWLES